MSASLARRTPPQSELAPPGPIPPPPPPPSTSQTLRGMATPPGTSRGTARPQNAPRAGTLAPHALPHALRRILTSPPLPPHSRPPLRSANPPPPASDAKAELARFTLSEALRKETLTGTSNPGILTRMNPRPSPKRNSNTRTTSRPRW